jgi:hypothetical protein
MRGSPVLSVRAGLQATLSLARATQFLSAASRGDRYVCALTSCELQVGYRPAIFVSP